MYIGAGFNSIIGILCPVLTALFAALLGKSFNRTAWLGIAAPAWLENARRSQEI